MLAKFSLIIRWSDEDHCYVAWVPELGTGVKTHGDTYEDAARAGREVIESWIELQEKGETVLPDPWLLAEPDEDSRLGRQLFPHNDAYDDAHLDSPKNVKNAVT